MVSLGRFIICIPINWYGNCSALDHLNLERVVNSGWSFPSIQSISLYVPLHQAAWKCRQGCLPYCSFFCLSPAFLVKIQDFRSRYPDFRTASFPLIPDSWTNDLFLNLILEATSHNFTLDSTVSNYSVIILLVFLHYFRLHSNPCTRLLFAFILVFIIVSIIIMYTLNFMCFKQTRNFIALWCIWQ